MSAGHLLPHQSRRNQKTKAEMRTRHRKWPLGKVVMTLTPQGYLMGRVHKHWGLYEYGAACSIDFDQSVDMGNANGSRLSHVIPFRNLRPAY